MWWRHIATCEDIALGPCSFYTCETWGIGMCERNVHVIRENCCVCGGGMNVTLATTTGTFEYDRMSQNCGSDELSCAVLSAITDTDFCAIEEIRQTCCNCQTSGVSFTVDMTATADGKGEICSPANLAENGDTHRGLLDSFEQEGVTAARGAKADLFCSDQRLSSHRIRSLQGDFVLVSVTTFTTDATTFFMKLPPRL